MTTTGTSCCDHCQTCICSTEVCQKKQNFCRTDQNASSYVDSPPGDLDNKKFKKDQIIIKEFPRSLFNQWGNWVVAAYEYGITSSKDCTPEDKRWNWTDENRDFIYAEKVNDLIKGMFATEGQLDNYKDWYQADIDIVYASYFQTISDNLRTLQLHPDACDMCNTACNAGANNDSLTCKTCQSCNSCHSCQNCIGYTTCHSPCHCYTATPSTPSGGGS